MTFLQSEFLKELEIEQLRAEIAQQREEDRQEFVAANSGATAERLESLRKSCEIAKLRREIELERQAAETESRNARLRQAAAAVAKYRGY